MRRAQYNPPHMFCIVVSTNNKIYLPKRKLRTNYLNEETPSMPFIVSQTSLPLRATANQNPPRRRKSPSKTLSDAIRTRATPSIPSLLHKHTTNNTLTLHDWRHALSVCLHDYHALEQVLLTGLSSPFANRLHISHFVRPLRNLASVARWTSVFRILIAMFRTGFAVKPDERLLVGLANIAVEKRDYVTCLQVFEFMKRYHVQLGPVSYSVLLKSHGRASNVVAVHKVLQEITNTGVVFDSVLLNSALDAYVRCDDLPSASRLVENHDFASLLDAASYNTIIKGFAAKGLVEDAFQAVRKMRADGCQPNFVTRNTLLSACVRAGDFDRAWEIIDRDNGLDMESRQLTIALTSLVAGLADVGRVADAIALLKDMTRRKAPPSPITYAALLTACFRHGAIEEAVDVFQGIPDSLRTLDVCNSCVAGLCRVGELHRVEEAAELLESMRYGAVRPNQATFNSLMDGFMRCGEFERAEHYLDTMEAAHVKSGIVTFTIMMKGFGDARQFGKAKHMFREISRRGLKPDRVALNAFVSICARSGDCEAAERVLAYMEREGGAISPGAYSYTPLIAAHARARRDEQLWATFNRMRDSGITLNDFLCELLCAYIADSNTGVESAKQGAKILQFGREDGVSAKILRKCRRRMLENMSDPKAREQLRELDEPEFRSASETIFERHGWNDIDSRWRVI